MNDEITLSMCNKNCGGTMIYECIHPTCPLIDSANKNQTNKLKTKGEKL